MGLLGLVLLWSEVVELSGRRWKVGQRPSVSPNALHNRPSPLNGRRIIARDPRRFAPVFLLAPPRSYSSVVTAMLGQHPELYSFPELVLFATDNMKQRDPQVFPAAGLKRVVAQLTLGRQDAPALRQATKWLTTQHEASVAHVYDHLLELVSPRVGIEKSPKNVAADEHLHRIRNLYPRARFIHLVRHPTTTARSIVTTFGDRTDDDASLFSLAYRRWYEVHRRIMTYTMDLPLERSYRVQGEQILNHPERELTKLAKWLGIRTDADAVEQMTHPERWPYARLGAPGEHLHSDWKFLVDPTLRSADYPSTIDAPEDCVIPQPLWYAVRRLALHFGYPDDASESTRRKA